MNDVVNELPKKPTIVIVAAILNFISVAFFVLLAVISLVVLIFGNVMGIYDTVTRQITHYYPQANLSLGLNMLFVLFLVVSLIFIAFYVLIGVGLLKGKKLAWYFQVGLSIFGLLAFPFGTILNAVILIFFFQWKVRDYFKV